MKHILLIALSLMLIVGCQTEQDETQNVEKVVYDLLNAITEFNYDDIRAQCTDDYMMFEGGKVMSMDDFINFLKGFEGKATISQQVDD